MPSEEELQTGLQLGAAVRQQPLPRPQFPHTDYVGMICDLAVDLQINRNTETKIKGATVVTPIDFLPADADASFAAAERDALEQSISEYLHGKRGVAAAVFRSLLGEWQFNRVISDVKAAATSNVAGTISFSALPGYDAETTLLYSEVGKLKLPNMPGEFDVSQKYIYTCKAGSEEGEADELVLYFCTKDTKDKPPEIDYHFLTLNSFTSLSSAPMKSDDGKVSGGGGWVARAYHPCGKDHYQAKYRFAFAGLYLKEMEIEFVVTGPNKDYISTTTLRR